MYKHIETGTVRSYVEILAANPNVSFPHEQDWTDEFIADIGYERWTPPVDDPPETPALRWLQPLEFRSHVVGIVGETAWLAARQAPELRLANETLDLSRLGIDPADAGGYLVAAAMLAIITQAQAEEIMSTWPKKPSIDAPEIGEA